MIEYGFYGRLTAEMPSQIIIDIDQNCNYACIHCPHGKFKKSNIYTGARMPMALNAKIIDEVRTRGKDVQQLRYTANGEPLLHPHAIEMLCYASEVSNTFVSLTTNGSLLDGEKSTRLLEAKIGLIDISLDAYLDTTYSAIRVRGDLNKVRQNVIDLLKLKKKMKAATRIVTSFVKQPGNENEVEQFEAYWLKQGVDQVVIRELHTAGGAMRDTNHVEDIAGYQPCVYPWERLCIAPTGAIEFCPASWEGKTELGFNIKDISLYEAWHSKEYENLRQEHLSHSFEKYKVCGVCPDRNHIIWPGKDDRKAYGDMISLFRGGRANDSV